MAGVTLDAGGLIGIERGDRVVVTLIADANAAGAGITVPAAVLAQVWRGPRNARLAAFIKGVTIEPLDEALAREAGALCGRSGTADAIDAIVVASAARRNDDIFTSDPHDLARLRDYTAGVGRIVTV